MSFKNSSLLGTSTLISESLRLHSIVLPWLLAPCCSLLRFHWGTHQQKSLQPRLCQPLCPDPVERLGILSSSFPQVSLDLISPRLLVVFPEWLPHIEDGLGYFSSSQRSSRRFPWYFMSLNYAPSRNVQPLSHCQTQSRSVEWAQSFRPWTDR